MNTTLENAWFASEEHRANYIRLLQRFNACDNPRYAAACYVTACPEIYDRVDWSESETPIGWCWGEWIGEDDYDEQGYHPESEIVGQLPVSYQGLVRSTVEWFTDSSHCLDSMSRLDHADDETHKLFLQSLQLRAGQITDNLRTGIYPYHIRHDLRQSDYFYNEKYTEFHEHDFESIIVRVSEEPEAFYLTEDDKKYYSAKELEAIERISK
ncbi:DUF2538 family protein [Saccharibacillus sp. O23]|uniref:DUF2538 family protein n=1 Tax=Saccharibacillus sp. O23 TaxID=2009338 RepID=UPI00211AAFD2|nr:DUF2538 family protein [Saccharibacillus sp. O23]